MKKILKRIIPLALALAMCLSLGITAFADEGPQCEQVTPYIVPGGEVEYDVLHETRGDYPPTSITTLPYNASATINSYVYTNYKFKPSTSGEIYTRFTGYVFSKTSTVTIYLYDASTGSSVTDYSLGAGSSWTNNGRRWYNLDVSHYYYFKVVKTGSNSLSFTLSCNTENKF